MLRIVRIDPDVVMIAVRAVADVGERLAAVGRAERARVQRVDDVLVLVIGEDVRVVERALADVAAGVDHLPGRAGIVGHQQAAVLVLDQRVDAVGIRGRQRDADLADHPRRHARVARDLFPGLAAVGRLEEAAARTAARHLILDAIRLPHRRVHHARVLAIDRDVDRAGLGVAEQHLLPGLAAVDRLEHAALVVVLAVAAEVGDEDDVGVGRMDADLRDRVGVVEADVRPGLAGVGGFVDAVAAHDVAADAGFAHADVDDVGIRLGDGDRADRGAGDQAVGDRRPLRAAIGRLPQAAADRAEVGFLRPSLDAGDRDRSAAAIRADAAPLEGAGQRRIQRAVRGRLCREVRSRAEVPAGGQRQRPDADDE